MDIRKYFSPVGAKSDHKRGTSDVKRKKTPVVVLDSDDEEPVPSKKKKNLIQDDSDEEIFEVKPEAPEVKSKSKSPQKQHLPKPKSSTLKAVSPQEFFSHRQLKGSDNKTKKVVQPNGHSDEEFELTLKALDASSKSRKISGREGSARKSPLKTGHTDRFTGDVDHQEDEAKTPTPKTEKKPSSSKASPSKRPSSPMKDPSVGIQLADKVPPIRVKSEEVDGDTSAADPGKKATPVKLKASSSKRGSQMGMEAMQPARVKQEDNGLGSPSVVQEKRSRAEAYRRYLHRAGPMNPGSKPIPKGSPVCLNGMTFVITGVMESLDREEAMELILSHGGKVTTNVSRNTTYLIVGDEAGQTKLSKAEGLKVKIIDEDALLELIAKGKDENKRKADGEGDCQKKQKVDLKSDSKAESPVKSSPTKVSLLTKPQIPVDSKQCLARKSPLRVGAPQSQLTPLQEVASSPVEVLMWVDKYKPSSLKNVIGQQGEKSNARKLVAWLQNWDANNSGTKKPRPPPWVKDDKGASFKAALLSGPPGVGKTTTAHLACRDLGYDFVEFNASDTRSKKTLQQHVSQLLSCQSLSGLVSGQMTATSRNHVLIMDEVDGMAGNEDRGGIGELISLVKSSKIPVICMCNDRNHPKIRSLANYCFDLRFPKPRLEQVRGAMMTVCFKEKIKIKPEALDQIILGANQDVRQVLHHLSVWSANQKTIDTEQAKADAQKAKKDLKFGPWDVCRSVFTESEHKNKSIHDKAALFFHDYSIGPLFVQENYPKVMPHCAQGNRRKTLERLAKTACTLADGDLIEKAIRSTGSWSLLPVQAIFSSVMPGEFMCGHLSGQIEFPRWLGNNSKRSKYDRIIQELQLHMRLRTSGSKTATHMEYCPSLRSSLLAPLVENKDAGISDTVSLMTSYDLLKEDLHSLLEVTQWTGKPDHFSSLDSKVKAALTRAINKENHMTPFAIVSVRKHSRGGTDVDVYDEEGEGYEEDDDDDGDVAKDAMIKVKPQAKKASEETVKKPRAKRASEGMVKKPRAKRASKEATSVSKRGRKK